MFIEDTGVRGEGWVISVWVRGKGGGGSVGSRVVGVEPELSLN